jgi:subtilase family serine protease/sugar lactone lactonase YvrE
MPGSAWTLFHALLALLMLFPAGAAAVNLASVTVNPKTVVSGSPFEVMVALDGPVPTGGIFVGLSTDNPSVVTGVYSWWAAAGATSAGLVFGTGFVESPTSVTIIASYGGVDKTATLAVTPRASVRGVAGDLWADVILGQPDFGEITFNEVTPRALFLPGGVTVDRSVRPNRVYVYDAGNSRVLGLSHLGVCSAGTNAGQNCTANSDCPGSTCAIQEARGADLVLGQPSFDRSACNGDGAFQKYPLRAPASAATLCTMPEYQISVTEWVPGGNMVADGAGNLYVTDFVNHRVLRYNSPFTTDTIADDVWGQADFSENRCNRGRGAAAPDNQSFCFERGDTGFTAGVAIDSGGNLWVADNSNNRVLRFPYDPATGSPGHLADLVLGQAGFGTSAKGAALNQMYGPAAVRVDGSGAVYVADSQNTRVLIFDPPVFSGKTAHSLNFAFNAAAGNSGTPTGLELDPAGGLWVNDTYNNQLLLFVGGAVQKVLFKDLPGSNLTGVTGDGPDFFSVGDATTLASWQMIGSHGSIGIDCDGNIFAAGYNDDVWRFPSPIPVPTRGIAHSADARLFKPYQLWISNEVGLAGFKGAGGVAVGSSQLIVSDAGRLLYWNNAPNLANGQAADGYVGVTDPLYQPPWQRFQRIREDGNSHLWTIWFDRIRAYSLPLHTGDMPLTSIGPTLAVLGGGSLTFNQYSFETGGIAPVGAGDKVWVSDPWTHRVFRIRNALTAPVVDIILGQNNASATACNQGLANPSRTSLCSPGAVRLDAQGNLYVSDSALEGAGNFRLLEYDAGLFPDSPTTAVFALPASRVFGTGGSFTARPSGQQEFSTATLEPAFTANGQMVVGQNGYFNPRFPYVYTNPLVSQHPDTFLNDFHSWAGAATFDSSDNLYIVDGDRGRLLIYLNPLSSPPPGSSTLTVTKTGGGTGTVKSVPFGIDCGLDCSQAYIDGTAVTLITVPATGSILAGWTGDADCGDAILTMSSSKTCTARFELMPDLIVSALTVPAGALAGSTFSVTDTTKNQTGTGQAAASTTKFYLSANSTWDVGDTLIGSRAVPILAPGATNTGPADVTIATGTATGTYYVIARADADGVLPESNEANNTKAVSIRVSPPDLIVSAISVPTTGGAGLTIIATNTTKNQTNTGPAAASTTRFYLSSNSTWDAGDTLIGSQAVGTLAPGASEVHSTSLTIPAGTTPGTKYVIAKADADGLVPETLETNNTASDTIVIGPDLIVSVLTVPTTGGAGLPITVNSTTKNQGGGGAAASTTKFYLSTNNTFGGGDVGLGDRAIGSLGPGTTSAGPTTLTIPAGTAVGTYYILALADDPNVVPETIETNNTTAALIKISPDLIVSVLGAPASAAAGGPAITVTDTTKNQGLGSAVATTTSFYLSTNTTYEAGDISLGSRAVPILASAATNAGSTSVTIPAGTAPGTWYILARADATGAVAETSETNNVASRAVTITP